MFSSCCLPWLGWHLTRRLSERQYKFRFGGQKNLKDEEWEFIDRECQTRAVLGKATVVCLNGEPLPPERVNLAITRRSRKTALGPSHHGRVEKRKPSGKAPYRPTALPCMPLLTHESQVRRQTQAIGLGTRITFRTPSPGPVTNQPSTMPNFPAGLLEPSCIHAFIHSSQAYGHINAAAAVNTPMSNHPEIHHTADLSFRDNHLPSWVSTIHPSFDDVLGTHTGPGLFWNLPILQLGSTLEKLGMAHQVIDVTPFFAD